MSADHLQLKHRRFIVERAYGTIFRRPPTEDEICNWTDFLINGGALGQLLEELNAAVAFIGEPAPARAQYEAKDPGFPTAMSGPAKYCFRQLRARIATHRRDPS